MALLAEKKLYCAICRASVPLRALHGKQDSTLVASWQMMFAMANGVNFSPEQIQATLEEISELAPTNRLGDALNSLAGESNVAPRPPPGGDSGFPFVLCDDCGGIIAKRQDAIAIRRTLQESIFHKLSESEIDEIVPYVARIRWGEISVSPQMRTDAPESAGDTPLHRFISSDIHGFRARTDDQFARQVVLAGLLRLCEEGESVFAPDEQGRMPLQRLLTISDFDFADIESVGVYGGYGDGRDFERHALSRDYVFRHAALIEHAARILMAFGAQIDDPLLDEQGDTLLTHLFRSDNVVSAGTLALKLGADPNAKNRNGETVWDIAKREDAELLRTWQSGL